MAWCCPACPLVFEDFEDYREHAKKQFGKMESFTKCCDSRNYWFDKLDRPRCDKCEKLTKLYEKFVDYIVPPLKEKKLTLMEKEGIK